MRQQSGICTVVRLIVALALGAVWSSPEQSMAQCLEGCTVLTVLDGEAAGDQFGWKSDNVGDLDADGIDDYAITAPTNDAGGNSAGRFYVYSGVDGSELFRVTGTLAFGQLGRDINPAGDLNADNVPDIIVSAPFAGAGRAYVFSGTDGAQIHDFAGEVNGDQFGTRVDGRGDIDGDGVFDLVVSATGRDSNGIDAGRVYAYSGADFSLICTVDGLAANDLFGVGLSIVGDMTGDGWDEFAVGAQNAGLGDRGQAYVYSYDGTDCQLLHTLNPTGAAVNFGQFFVDGGRDVNADGTPDVYVADFDGNRAYVYSGTDGSLIHELNGDNSGGFGLGEIIDDVNGDGHADLFLAAWVFAAGGPQAGKAYVYSGQDGSLLEEFTHDVPGATFGFDLNGLRDVNLDGRTDYLVTAAWDLNQKGRAYVIAGTTEQVPPAPQLLVSGWSSNDVVGFHPVDGTVGGEVVVAGSGGLSSPTDAVFGPDGNLYVVSFNSGQVLRFDGTTGAYLGVFATGPAPGRLEMLEWGADGHLYAATGQENSVVRFDGATGAALPGPLGGAGTAEFVPSGSGGIVDAHHLTFGPDGDLYVTSMDDPRVVRFDGATGALVSVFVVDNPGTGEDETGGLSSPHGLTFLPGGDLLVCSFGTNNVLRYDGTTGAFVGVFATGGGLLQPTHLVLTPSPADFDGDGDVDDDDQVFFEGCISGSGVPLTGPGCEAADFDADGDVDCGDAANFKRSWTGPPEFPALIAACDEDCNTNGVADDIDIRLGGSGDCNTNGVPDECDIADGTSTDNDGDGEPDECCESIPPVLPAGAVAANRYLPFIGSVSDVPQAMRVTFVDLPGAFAGLNGTTMWVGPPVAISENPGSVDPADAPGSQTFMAAPLQCAPFFADWSTIGTVHVFHEAIVPGGQYSLQSIDNTCDQGAEQSFSAPLSLDTSRWGDLVKDCATTPCGAPDGSVDVATDVVALLDKFSSLPTAPIKARCDLEPGVPDHVINITDVTRTLDAFSGASYPFPPPPAPCAP